MNKDIMNGLTQNRLRDAMEDRLQMQLRIRKFKNTKWYRFCAPFRWVKWKWQRAGVRYNKLALLQSLLHVFFTQGFPGVKRKLAIRAARGAGGPVPAGLLCYDAPRSLRKKQRKCKKDLKNGQGKLIRIMVYGGGDMEAYAKTVASVQEQTHTLWDMMIVHDGSYTGGETDKITTVCTHTPDWNQLTNNRGPVYYLFVKAGDILRKCALSDLLEYTAEGQCLCAYWDEAFYTQNWTDGTEMLLKPGLAIDWLRNYDYIAGRFAVSPRGIRWVNGFRTEAGSAVLTDLILRLAVTAPDFCRVPRVLSMRPKNAPAMSDGEIRDHIRAVEENIAQCGYTAKVTPLQQADTYRVCYELAEEPLVSIIIPNKDNVDVLSRCIDGLRTNTSYSNWEVFVVENNSTQEETFAYYKELEQDPRITVLYYEGGFNYSRINNFAAEFAKGDYLLLLNNDVEPIDSNWLTELVSYGQLGWVGAVGCKLLFPDRTVQHAGVAIGIRGVAGHTGRLMEETAGGNMNRMNTVTDLSAVTAACVLIPRHVWEMTGGLDESFAVDFNDVDFCLRIRRCGFSIVYNPYAKLFHHESKTRETKLNEEQAKRFNGEVRRFQQRWLPLLEKGDPFYHPLFDLGKDDFTY